MADAKELTLIIVCPLVSQPEAVSLEIEGSTDLLEYNLTVAKEGIGRIIGKQGCVAKAIRTTVYSVHIDGPERVRSNILNGKQVLTRR